MSRPYSMPRMVIRDLSDTGPCSHLSYLNYSLGSAATPVIPQRSIPSSEVSLTKSSVPSISLLSQKCPLRSFCSIVDLGLGTRHFRLRVVRFSFFYDCPHLLSWRHFQFSARSSGRDCYPYGARLVLDSPLSIPRTHSANDHRERRSTRIR